MTKLTLEEQQDVMELTKHEGWRPLLKMLEMLVEKQERELVTMPLDADTMPLLFCKARSEGARKLLVSIKAESEKWRK